MLSAADYSVANKRYRIAICDAILASCDPRSILCRSRLQYNNFQVFSWLSTDSRALCLFNA